MDWSIARTIARLAAGGEGPAASGIDVVAFCAEMEPTYATTRASSS